MQFEQIINEVVEEMVTPAYVEEDKSLAVALFDSNNKHVFSIQRITDEETKQLVLDLREWLKGGMEKVLERNSLAKAVGG